jgi:hypothetical protein
LKISLALASLSASGSWQASITAGAKDSNGLWK